MLYLAIGILGATVMPHNLYLHSSIVQTRAFGLSGGQNRKPSVMPPWTPPSRLDFRFS